MSQDFNEVDNTTQLTDDGLNSAGSRQKYFIRGGQTFFRFASGKEVQIKNISPLLGQKLRERYPEPPIPNQTMPKSDGVGTYDEPNPNDETYRRDFTAWQEKIESLSRKMVINLAVLPFVNLDETDRREVKVYRDFMRELDNVELEDSDEFCFVAYCLIKSLDDYNRLTEAVMNRTNPTEAAIVRAIAGTFPAIVPGSAVG